MTLVLKPDLDMVKMDTNTEVEIPNPYGSEKTDRQTDKHTTHRHTDLTEIITYCMRKC